MAERRGGGGVADDNRRRNKNGDSAAERVVNNASIVRTHTHPHAPNLGQQIAGWDARGLPAATAPSPEGSFDDDEHKMVIIIIIIL